MSYAYTHKWVLYLSSRVYVENELLIRTSTEAMNFLPQTLPVCMASLYDLRMRRMNCKQQSERGGLLKTLRHVTVVMLIRWCLAVRLQAEQGYDT
jgi:hypothetical protein